MGVNYTYNLHVPRRKISDKETKWKNEEQIYEVVLWIIPLLQGSEAIKVFINLQLSLHFKET